MARILVVDDEREILEFVVDQLKVKGHFVVGLTSAVLALEVLSISCNQFDLIISDVMMPKQNGLDFARAYSKLPHSKTTVFALMSSYSNELKGEILDLGIRHSLHKPFTHEQLNSFIQRIFLVKSTKES